MLVKDEITTDEVAQVRRVSRRQMQRARVNGIDLAYEVIGEGKEPLVLIHGGVVADAFAPLLAQTALTTQYKLINYHRRGYGLSERADGPVSIEQQADDCMALMRHLGVEEARVVGYSFGGTIALQLALAYPGAVHSLALLEPVVPGMPMDPAAQQVFFETLGRAYSFFGQGDAAAAVDTFASGAFGPGYREVLERAVPGAFEQAVADAGTMFGAEFPALQEWSFTQDDATRIEQPVLSVYHPDPNWSGFQATHDFISSSLPNLESYVAPTTSHLLQIVEPQAIAEAVAKFFAHQTVE